MTSLRTHAPIVTLGLWLLLAGSASAQTPAAVRVTDDTAILFAAADATSERLATIPSGTRADVIGGAGTWYHVVLELDGKLVNGWLHASTVEPDGESAPPAPNTGPLRFPTQQPAPVDQRPARPASQAAPQPAVSESDLTSEDARDQLAIGFGYGRSEGFNSYGVGAEFDHFLNTVAGLAVQASWQAVDIPIVDATGFSIAVGPRLRFVTDTRVTPSLAVFIGATRATISASLFDFSESVTSTFVSGSFAVDIRMSDSVALRAIEPTFGVGFAEGESAAGFGFNTGLVVLFP